MVLIDKDENQLTKLVRVINVENRKNIFLCLDINNIPKIFYKRFKKDKIILLNFAALKHVRSEVHNESLINMLETNCISPFKLFIN